tara:strand:+ start:271 stop:546 length:276 start_codon:yes stop_codon:yes gene_type:complete
MKELNKKIVTDEFINSGIVSTYMMLVEKKSFDEVYELQNKYNKDNIFFIAPSDLRNQRFNELDLNAMIEYFIITEEYEKCAKLVKIKNKLK